MFDSEDTTMRLFLLALCTGTLVAACQADLGLDEQYFACETDGECGSGYQCVETSQYGKVCREQGWSDDAGDDDAPSLADGELRLDLEYAGTSDVSEFDVYLLNDPDDVCPAALEQPAYAVGERLEPSDVDDAEPPTLIFDGRAESDLERLFVVGVDDARLERVVGCVSWGEPREEDGGVAVTVDLVDRPAGLAGDGAIYDMRAEFLNMHEIAWDSGLIEQIHESLSRMVADDPVDYSIKTWREVIALDEPPEGRTLPEMWEMWQEIDPHVEEEEFFACVHDVSEQHRYDIVAFEEVLDALFSDSVVLSAEAQAVDASLQRSGSASDAPETALELSQRVEVTPRVATTQTDLDYLDGCSSNDCRFEIPEGQEASGEFQVMADGQYAFAMQDLDVQFARLALAIFFTNFDEHVEGIAEPRDVLARSMSCEAVSEECGEFVERGADYATEWCLQMQEALAELALFAVERRLFNSPQPLSFESTSRDECRARARAENSDISGAQTLLPVTHEVSPDCGAMVDLSREHIGDATFSLRLND